jgi:hypothetical protein
MGTLSGVSPKRLPPRPPNLRSANQAKIAESDYFSRPYCRYACRMGELLTSRRAVDLCRVGSCLCRGDAI